MTSVRLASFVTALCFCAAASADPAPVDVDIAAQPIDGALREFGRQTGLQLFLASVDGKGVTTSAVRGGYTADEALRKLLSETGLRYEYIDERTIAIRPIADRPDTTQDSARPQPSSPPTPTSTPRPTPGATPAPAAPPAPRASTTADLSEVVVTGTHIRGAQNPTAPVTVYTRRDIERTGYTSVQQLIDAIPQNFGGDAGGVSEDGLLGAGSGRFTNAESASAINLRGLGVGSTLVLINGRRVAPSANAAAVDVSIIPLAAIERVEVLTDGSSAIYGSEAVAGVVNFVLRRDYEGAETRLGFGTVTDGGVQELTASQMLGNSWNSGDVLLGVQYQQRDALSAADRAFTSRVPMPTDLLPKREQTNVLLSARQQLPAGVDVFAQGLYSDIDVTRDQTEVNRDFLLFRSNSENRHLSLGVGYRPGADWRVELVALHGRQLTDFRGEATPVGVFGPLDFTRDFELNAVELKGDGRLFDVPAGTVRLAVGAAYRDESYAVEHSGGVPPDRNIGRNVSSAYAELSVPLVGTAQGVPGIHALELSAAYRYDDYSDFGDTTNPRIGVVWSPTADLHLRAAYSTSFRAPNTNELDLAARPDNLQAVPYPLLSPGGTGRVTGLLVVGAKDLQPEEARSWTFGLSYDPSPVPGLSLTFNYYDIKHTNRIATPPFALNVLQRPEIYGDLIQRYDNDAQVQAAVDAIVASGGRYRDVFGLGLAGIRYGFDARLQNFAAVSQRGLDVGAEYHIDVGEHAFQAGVYVTSIDEILTSYGEGTQATNVVNTVANPLRWRGRGNLGWNHGAWSANAFVNYTNAYRDATVTPSAPVGDWLTFDLNLGLTLGDDIALPWLRGTSMGLSVVNAFDKDPPTIVGTGLYPAGYDVANATPLGRFISLSMRKAW